jgi:PEGA domain-containing protein
VAPSRSAAAAEPPPSLVPSPLASSRPEPPADPGKGELQIGVIPWGEVVLDGRSVGSTPLDKMVLGAGPHTVRVRHPLYEIVERRVVVRAGELEKVLVNLPAEGVRKQ